MRVFHTDDFPIDLPAGHRFPLEKYSLLREALEGRADHGLRFHVPGEAGDSALLTTHDRSYLERLESGGLSRSEVLRLGLPQSPSLLVRARRSCGATIEAVAAALEDGVAASLAGGTHHAFRDRGEGFCLFNDSVVAARVHRNAGRLDRLFVIDLDVHQGNGTAELVAADSSIFAYSVHCARNYPHPKKRGDCDVELPAGVGDEEYLGVVEETLGPALRKFAPDVAIYIAGADPYHRDRLGRMALTREGLARRDTLVFETCREMGLPVAMTLGGGYADPIAGTVDIQTRSVLCALESWRLWSNSKR